MATTGDPQEPRRAAARLHDSLFDVAPPAAYLELLAGALERIAERHDDDERRRFARAIAGRFDLEALELAARQAGRLPMLTQALRAAVRLAEPLPTHRHFLVAGRPGRLVAAGAMLRAPLRALLLRRRGRRALRTIERG